VPSDTKQNIQQLNTKIGQAADSLQNRTRSNAANIRKTINRIQLALIIVSGVMLLLVLLGLLFAACGVRPIVYFLVVVGWVLVVGTWILCGVFILLNNAIGDTCVAMQEWVAHPYAKTTLDAILPCVDPQTGANTLLQSKAIVSTIASNVDLAITIVANNNNQLVGPPLFYNQSGPAVPTLCNPYGAAPNYPDQACPAGSLTFATAPQAWSHFICPSINGICSGPGRLTQDLYNQLAAASNVSYGLEQYSPFLVDLEDCQTVRNTFTAIQTQHCHRMRKDTKWVWVGLAIISVGSMLSILLWMLYIRRRNMRYKRARYGKGSYA
jgi:F0F1-type ATP synthase assembly protein I